MRRTGRYGSYRGRSPLRMFLKAMIIFLLLVLLLGIFSLVFLQQYIVYSADGIRLDLPFLKTEATPSPSPQSSPEPSVSQPLVVVTPEVREPEWLHAVALPREALYDGTAASQVEAAGGNAALFDMKADDGSLGYVSTLAPAIAAKVSSGDPAVNAAIRALNETGLYTVARISCFKDQALSNPDYSLAITTNSGYRWTDPDKVRWVSPTNEAVREYLTGVCVELAELGFDEIVLDNGGYPTQGNLNYIRKGAAYDKAAFASVIGGFYTQVAEALKDSGVKLSILTDGATVTAGKNELSGQTVENLSAHADRIWLRDGEEAGVQAMTAAGLSEEAVVLAGSQPGSDASSWAILTVSP